jgi:hypothetical protein
MYGSGTFNANITSLTPGTTYYYQSQVQGLYTVSSDIGSFVYKGPLAMQATLPAGQVNVAYSGHLTVSGGTSPYNISATGLSGTGLSVDPSTGAVSGTPGSVGTITFNVTITDSATPTNNTLPSGQLSIVIKPAVNGLNHIAITPNSPSVITSGQVTFAAQAYDSGNNPISNPSYTWSCSDATAGTINSSGVFAAGSTTGTYTNVITAKSGSVTGYASVTVTGGTADHISIETSPYGSGIVVPSQTLTSGNAITVYAISRDASNNFIANVAVTWSLTNINTGVVSGDLVPSGDTKSAVFTGHVAGSATIHIINGSSTADSGTITVTAGAATKLAFTQLPSSSPASTNFVTQVTVEDTYGNIVTNPSIPITLAIGTNPSGGTLTVSGGNPINSLNGVAAFSGVSINWAGTYTLTATSGTLTVTSSSFNITAIIRTWTGTGTNDNFSAANHWTGNSVPGVGDSLIIISPGTYYCNFDNTANNFVYGTLSLGSGSTPGTLQWPAGGTNTLQVTNINPAIVGSKIDMTNGGTLQVSGSWTTTNMTFTRGTGTVNYNGAAQTVAAFTYNNLTLSGSGAKTLGAATTSISGNLILSDTATTTTGAALAIGGNLIIGNGTTFATGATNTWTLTVSGTTSVSQTLTLANTGAKIFAGLVTINAGGTWNNSGNSPVTFRGGITNNGTFTAGSGIYTFGTNSQALTGTFIIPSVTVTGVTLTNNGSLTVATALTGTGGLTNSATRTLNIGGTCSITTLTNAGTATITNTSGGAISTILANFTNTGIINLNGTGTIAGITNNAAGIVNLNSSGIITSFNNAAATSTLNISASPVPTITTLTATFAGNTVNYTGTGQTLKVTAYYNLTLSGGAETFGAITTIGNNLTLSGIATATTAANLTVGNLSIGDGTTFTVAGFTLTVNGATTIGSGVAGGALVFNSVTNPVKTFVGLVTINTLSSWTESAAITPTFRGGITNNGTFTAVAGVHTFSTNSQALNGTLYIPSVTVTGVTLTNNGSLTVATALTGTGGLTNSATRTLNIGGTCSITTLTNAGTATITNTSGGAISTILANFTNTGIINLNGTGTIAGITNNAAGIVNLNSSGIITSFNNAAATSTLNISASPVPTITTLTATFAGNTMNYTGTGAQTVKATTYYNLGFSGARDANNITINGIVGVAGTLTNIATFGTGNFVLTGSTITYNGTGAQTVTNLNYNNLTLSGGGAKTLDPAMATIGGTLTLSGTASTTTVAALTIGGNLVVGTGTTFATGTTNTCILGVTGTTSITGTLTIANTGTQTFTGAVTVNSGGTLTESAAAVVAIAGSLTNNGTYTASTGVHTFSGAAKTISGTSIISIPTATFTGAYTNSGTLTVGTLLTIIGVTLTNNGTITATAALSGTGGLTQGTNATLNIGSTSGITTLTATAAGNTVNYIGAVQTIHSNSYYYLTLSGSGAKTMGSGPSATSVTGKMTIASPAKASILAGVGINVRALFFGSANQAVGTWGYSGRNHNDTTYFDNTTGYLIVAAVSPITSTAAGGLWTAPTTWLGGIAPNGNDDVVIATTTVNSVTLGAALTQYGTLTINSGATLTETAAAALSFGADVNINGTLTEFGAAVVGFAGNLTKNGTYTASSSIHTFSGSGKTISGTSIISIPTATFTGAYTNSGTLTVGTLLTITGVTLTNNGTITATTALSGTGGLTNGTTGMLNIGGTSGITTLTATASGNTVNYFMGGQTVKSTNYYNLTLSGTGTDVLQAGTTVIGGTLTLSGTISTTMVTGLTISGNLNIGTGTTLAASTYALNVSGDWSNSGTFTCGTGTVTLNGSSVQTIGGSTATTFYNLILSGSGAKTIPSGTVISNNLSIAPTGSATASIAAGANITANTLTLGGTLKPGTNATWGSTASAATNKNDTYFTTGTTGYLTVAH